MGSRGWTVTDYAGAFSAGARRILDRIEDTQMPAIAGAAEVSAVAIAGGGLVHLFGTGHSRIPLEEMFPRYGSYPGFHPIAELSMTFHTQIAGSNGQRQAMFIERVEGLAPPFVPHRDVLVIADVAAMDDHPGSANRLGRFDGLRQVLARGDADPVVR